MVDVRRIASVLGLLLLSWTVLAGMNVVLDALSFRGLGGLVLECAVIAIVAGGAGLVVAVWALEKWSSVEAFPFAAVGIWVAIVHLSRYGLDGISLGAEVAAMSIGAFAAHGLLAGLAHDIMNGD